MDDDFQNATHIRFGKAACARCGHHPIMHMSAEELLTGIKGPCEGANEGEPPCTCMAYVRSAGDEQAIIPETHPKENP